MRVTPGFGVWTLPKKSLNSGGVLTISINVAALMKEGKERLGSRTKSSPCPSAIMRVACASWSGSVGLVSGANRSGSEDDANDARILLLSLVSANRCPAGAVSNQHHLLESADVSAKSIQAARSRTSSLATPQ